MTEKYNDVPIEYYPQWVLTPDSTFRSLREELDWVRRLHTAQRILLQ